MLFTENRDYPDGSPGQIAVCFFLASEAAWSFEIANNRSEAEESFQKAWRDPAVLSVPIAGGKGAVVWMMQCQSGEDWVCIKRTKGAEAYLDPVWF